MEVFLARSEVAGSHLEGVAGRVQEARARRVPQILDGYFRGDAVLTANMSIAVWGGTDYSVHYRDDQHAQVAPRPSTSFALEAWTRTRIYSCKFTLLW